MSPCHLVMGYGDGFALFGTVQRKTVPSREPAASCRPSADQLMPVTRAVGPVRVACSSPDSTAQMRKG